jgi:hypothetical protein
MTAPESTIPPDLNHGYFDSVEIGVLSIAFEKAWAFVEFDPMLGQVELTKRQSELARCLMRQLKLGETNPTSLANTAIRMLRKNRKVSRRRLSGDREASFPEQRSASKNPQLLLRYR